MKKTFFAACCSLVIAGTAFAQEGTTTPTPDIPAASAVETVVPAAAAPSSVEIATTEAEVVAPVAVAVGQEVIATEGVQAPLSTTQFNEGLVIESGVPMTEGQVIEGNQFEMAPSYNQGFVDQGFGQSVMAPSIVQPAPAQVYNAPVATQYNAPVVANSDPFAVSANAAAPCVNCEPQSRRRVIRSVTTRGRSMFTRVRGVFGRRR